MPTSLCNGVNRKDEAALQALKSGLRLGIARLRRRRAVASAIAGRAARLSSLGRCQVHAGNARHDSRRWHEQRHCPGSHPVTGNSAPRLGQLSTLYAKLFRGGQRCLKRRIRAAAQCDVSRRRRDVGGRTRLRGVRASTHDFIEISLRASGRRTPEDPFDQLDAAALAVYALGERRAQEYRKINGLQDWPGQPSRSRRWFSEIQGIDPALVWPFLATRHRRQRAICRIPVRCSGETLFRPPHPGDALLLASGFRI